MGAEVKNALLWAAVCLGGFVLGQIDRMAIKGLVRTETTGLQDQSMVLLGEITTLYSLIAEMKSEKEQHQNAPAPVSVIITPDYKWQIHYQQRPGGFIAVQQMESFDGCGEAEEGELKPVPDPMSESEPSA